jgi:dTDP-glucose 4,6-dehydratase
MARRVVVTGGAGFLGSHLCRSLLDAGNEVIAIDNLSTGRIRNLADLHGRHGFVFAHADITEGLSVEGAVDAIFHLASPASPPRYLALPIETLRVGSIGTEHVLQLAEAKECPMLLASTSEVYGDPSVHPQPEEYWGNVNPVGPRSVYDEAKRYAEAITMAYHRTRGVRVSIARIFNTYGPQLDPADGRVVSNFVVQALRNEPLTVYGDGRQTRSFCYVDDTVAGLLALFDSGLVGAVNIGNPNEFTMLELAELVCEVVGATAEIIHRPLPQDDPVQRCPDIALARKELGWEPRVALREGLERTVRWFRTELA